MAKNVETPQPPETPDTGAQAEQPEGAQPPEAAAEVSKDARMWAMFCHLGGLAGYIMPIIGNVVAPLIVWQIKKDEFGFVDGQGREAVNFQISMSLYALIGIAVCLVTCIGAVLIPVVAAIVGIVDLVFLLIAAVKANNGESYRYPLTIRFIK
ncbi:MAG: DUF4870 domain-containing protein [Planctomycetota bacterium]|jgi:uncharacterized Tic20 family protein